MKAKLRPEFIYLAISLFIVGAVLLALYRIYRTGVFENVSVKGSEAFLSGKFSPYRDGYLLVTDDGGARGQGGLYAVESGDLRRKAGGNLVAISLSPSGCRLTVSEFTSTIPEASNLKIIQLCDGAHND